MPVIEVSHLTKEYRLGALQGFKRTMLNVGVWLIHAVDYHGQTEYWEKI